MDNTDSNPASSAHAAPPEAAVAARRRFVQQWREAVSYFGWRRTLREAADALWFAMTELLPSRRKARFGDLDFDWERSVDTTRSNVGFRAQLAASLRGRPYFASEPWLFDEIMQALPVDHSQFTFVDLGAGKGRALLMASDYPFRRIIGVECVPELHRAAQKNIAGYSSDRQRCRCIEALCMDARDFEFPPEPLAVYLFNPFSEPTFAAVLEKLRRSFEQAPRAVYIAYRFTEFEGLLAESGWLKKVAGTEQWAVHEASVDRA
jgi:hypothetical protein